MLATDTKWFSQFTVARELFTVTTYRQATSPYDFNSPMSSSLARRNNSYISIAKWQHVGRHWCPSHTGSTVEHKRYIVRNERIATWLWVSLCRGQLKLSAINRIRVRQPVSDIKTKGNVKRAYIKSGFFELLIVKDPFSNFFQGPQIHKTQVTSF